MKLSKLAALSFAGLSAVSASAYDADPGVNDVLLQINYSYCLTPNRIAAFLKGEFNQDKAPQEGKFLGQRATLYAEEETYTIVVDVPSNETDIQTTEPILACILESKAGDYRTSAQYQRIFKP